MTKQLYRPLLAAFLTAGALGATNASAETLQFGTPIAGTGPTANFATLDYTQTGDGDDWTFSLTTQDLAAVFGGASAFIGSVAVQVSGDSPNYGSGVAMTGVTGGVTDVSAVNGGGPGGDWDFRFALGGGAGDRLGSNETVTWNWTDSGYASFADFALHVQGLEGNGLGYSGSIWYGTAPIPEPGTYAMLLAGLAGLGAFARRRDRQGRSA